VSVSPSYCIPVTSILHSSFSSFHTYISIRTHFPPPSFHPFSLDAWTTSLPVCVWGRHSSYSEPHLQSTCTVRGSCVTPLLALPPSAHYLPHPLPSPHPTACMHSTVLYSALQYSRVHTHCHTAPCCIISLITITSICCCNDFLLSQFSSSHIK
jgi:hypothetical protein